MQSTAALWMRRLLVALSGLVGCAAQTVVIDGREVPVEEAAQMTLDEGKEAEAAGNEAEAEARYRDVLDMFPETDVTPAALGALASLKKRVSGCDAARYYDERLLDRYPKTPQGKEAAARRAACTGVDTPVENVPPTIRAEYEAASTPGEKAEIASRAADQALAADDPGTAVLWLLEVDRIENGTGSGPPARPDIREEIEALISGRLSARELRMVLERSKPGRFPHETVSYKLARVHHHVGDFENARTELQAYLKTYPEGVYADGARRALQALEAVGPVVPNRLGVLLPLSGRHKSYGELALQAIRLALEDAPGIELVVADTESDPVRAAARVEELVMQSHVIAILGPIFTYEAKPAAIAAQRLAVPLLTVSAADDIASVGPYVFRNGLTNAMQAKALVAYAMDTLGYRNFAVLYPKHPYGEELLHLFWDEVQARRGEIRGVESYQVSDTTFSQQVKSLVARDDLERRPDYVAAARECREQPDSYRQARCRENLRKNLKPIVDFDALFIPDYPRPISMITAALAFEDVIVERDPKRLRVIERTLGRKVKPVTLLGASGWNSEKLIERADRNVENAIFTDGFFADADEPTTREFVARYREKHRRTPRLYPEALFFDSAQILKGIFAQSPAERSAFRDALARVDGFQGVTGETSFAGGTDAQKTVRLLTIRDGEIMKAPPEGFEGQEDDGDEPEPKSGAKRTSKASAP